MESFKIATGFLAELDAEFPKTRRFLVRLPEEKLLWKPHEKSKSAGVLAMGIPDSSELPDLSKRDEPETVAEILAALSWSEEQVRQGLPLISDARMHENIAITKDGAIVMTIPRVGFFRQIMLNHWYHHRGQFGVYLRLLGCVVPSSYGPSGDES